MYRKKGTEDEYSVYYGCSAQEVCEKYVKNERCYSKIVFILTIVSLVFYIILLNANRNECILLLLFDVVLLYSRRINSIRKVRHMEKILSADCDPVKLLQVFEYAETTCGSGKKVENFLKIRCCRLATGKSEEGFAELMSYNSSKLVWNYEVVRLSEIINYAFIMNNRDVFMQAKKELEELPSRIRKHNKKEEKTYNQVMKQVRLKELFWDEHNEEARQLAKELMQIEKTRYNKVFTYMLLAQLDLRENNYESAKEYLEFVIEQGNTLFLVDDAKKLLEEIKAIWK